MPSTRLCRILAAFAVLVLSLANVSCQGSAPPEEDWDRHVQDVQQRAAPLVRAVYKFQASCGLWPYSLDELTPDYASPQQIRGWDYTWHLEGWWYLTDYGAFPNELLRYKHVNAKKAGWLVTAGEGEDRLAGGGNHTPGGGRHR